MFFFLFPGWGPGMHCVEDSIFISGNKKETKGLLFTIPCPNQILAGYDIV